MKSKPQTSTRPWPEILTFYEDLSGVSPAFESMRSLVADILRSRYVSAIHAWTSMHDLCIVQREVTYPFDGPFLRVSPVADGRLDFRFVDTYIEEEQWHRVVPGTAGFSRLERFFFQVHWFYPAADVE